MQRQWMRILALAAACTSWPLLAEEGMWPLGELPLASLAAAHEFNPPAGWQENLRLASLRLNGGCSAAFVSGQGLVLTNQHCISRCLAQLSGQQHDLLAEGFIAREASAEAICPELELNQLLGETALAGEPQSAARQAELQTQCRGGDPNLRCEIVQRYGGSETRLLNYRRFRDVRLVFAPETGMARFGGNRDSFTFPRYALDMALLRVYEDGQPYTSPHFFAPHAQGAAEGELVFVTGHPGSTQRDLTDAQLQTLREVILPQRIRYLEGLHDVLLQHSTDDASPSIERELLGIENTLKVLRGRLSALSDPAFMADHAERQQALRTAINERRKLRKRTAQAWEDIARAEQLWREIYTEYSMLELLRGYQSDLFSIARHLVRASREMDKPDAERMQEYSDADLPRLTQRLFSAAPIDKDLERRTLGWSLGKLRELLGPGHPIVQLSLAGVEPEQRAAELIDRSQLDDPRQRQALWDRGAAAIADSDDPLIRLALNLEASARAVRARYEHEVRQVVDEKQLLIARTSRQLGRPDTGPAADFTLRVGYGQVRGWQEAGLNIPAFTTLGGALVRASDQAPYRLPQSWLRAEPELDLATPMNFTTTNDIVAGHSGSPVLDTQGRLVGLVFDGNSTALGGVYGYDAPANRAIALHPAMMQLALLQVYQAPELTRELFGETP